MRLKLLVLSSMLVALSYLFLSPSAWSQDVASITGVVTDQSGAVIPDATVTLQNPQTGVTYRTVTNAAGSYTLNEVKPGPGYQVRFEHAGFNSVMVAGLYLNVDATRTQDAHLTVGNTQQTVQVSAANQDVTLDTTDATVGNNFQVQFLNELPIQIRSNPSALFTQQPGVTLDGAVTGARVDQDNVSVDGLDVNDLATGNFGSIVANAPVDSVQEFRGVTSGQLSSAGEGGGGQYELVTRSGSNDFHGQVSEYHRDTDLEANNWFNNNANVPRPPLVRNQFGGDIGGPILKNRLFFFFDYYGRRDTLSDLVERTVPTDSFRNGSINYLNSSGGVGSLNSAQVAALDPQGVGFDPTLLSFINSRYPHANDFSGAAGDLLNTAGFRFNAPFPLKEDIYVARLDYTINSKMKLFAVGHDSRENSTDAAIQFPGDPETYPFLDKSYTYAIGHTWSIGANKVNQVEYGETYENFNFPNTFNPPGINQFETFGGNGTGGALLTAPYARAINAQSRTYPVPLVKDDFNWQKGSHGWAFGGTFKWVSPNNNTILDYNTPTVGLGGFTSNLDASLRPADIGGGTATGLYDSAFALALAPYTSVGATYNYDATGTPVPQGTGEKQDFRYYETELYFGDTWKVTPSLTISYGLRWQNYTVPYERHGLESVDQFGGESVHNSTFDRYFGDRVAQSAQGIAGNLAVPLFSYSLGGKANHAPGLYHTDNRNFAPRVAFAYSPGFDRKTVFNGGAGVVYDHTVINAILYQQTQFDYLFEASATQPLGVPGNPTRTLLVDQRFNGISSPPPPPAAPAITKPFYPFVDFSSGSAVPTGLANGQAFNEIVSPDFRTPYSIQFNFGFQHEFPQGYILKTSYVGRLGRRLLAQADANQLVDFPDLASGQTLSAAFANLSQQLRAGVDPLSVTPQAWYENVLGPGTGASFGFPSNSALVAYVLGTLVYRGDFADTTEALSAFGLLPPNVGLASQFSENTAYTNKGFSSYNGLLTTLHKNAGYGLQFDLNYTWSHSIDNVSAYANQIALGGYGFICDALRPRECRSNSDFDVTNYISGNFIYDMPFGRGKALAPNASRWVNELIGGWKLSGIPSWHTGNAYFAASNAFVAGYANDAPAILVGPKADLKAHVTGGKGSGLFAYANPAKALSDFVGPLGFQIGSRNNLRGPGYFNLDSGLGKAFAIYGERVKLNFRGDAFNVLNHPSFNPPDFNANGDFTTSSGTDITEASGFKFGTIQSTANNARVMQVSARLEF